LIIVALVVGASMFTNADEIAIVQTWLKKGENKEELLFAEALEVSGSGALVS
jgi:hypothetical protein